MSTSEGEQVRHKEELKAHACAAIDASGDEIASIADDLFEHPELGFKETWAAGRVQQVLAGLGVPFRSGLALTGVKGMVDSGRPGPTVALLGELDSVLVPSHPLADRATGAAHACGHPMQLAAMLGAGLGIVRSGALEWLDGRLVLFAVPAEELVDLQYRLDLVGEGRIEFLGGKAELVRLGEFDDIDIALMVHASSSPDDRMASINSGSNAMVIKRMQFVGKAAHAGSAPWEGINALNAANLALSAINAQRETFQDSDFIRVHPIVTRGGSQVNVVPDDVRIETYVRGRDSEAVAVAGSKVDRAARAGALAVGGRLRIQTLPGYLPLRNDPTLAGLFIENMLSFISPDDFSEGRHWSASTDMGDISQLIPSLHPQIGGATGTLHAEDFACTNTAHLYGNAAKCLAMTVIDLLSNEAAAAREVVSSFVPAMSRTDYVERLRKLSVIREYDFQGDEKLPRDD